MNDPMNDEIEQGEHGSLTLNRLIALVAVGVVCWLGLIRIGVAIWEII